MIIYSDTHEKTGTREKSPDNPKVGLIKDPIIMVHWHHSKPFTP